MQEVWGIRGLYVASISHPNSNWIKQQRRLLGSAPGTSGDWVGFRNGLNEHLNDIIKDGGSFCPLLCHPSISFTLRPAFLLVTGWLPATVGGLHASTFTSDEERLGRSAPAFQVGVLSFTSQV